MRKKMSYSRFTFLLILALFIFFSGCISEVKNESQILNSKQKVLVKVNVNTPFIENATTNTWSVSKESFIDYLSKVIITVKDVNDQIVFTKETTNKTNIYFEIELLPGTYTFEVKGYEEDLVIFSGEKVNQIIDEKNNIVNVETFFVNGIVRTIIEVDDIIYENYDITSATLIFKKDTAQEDYEEVPVTITGTSTLINKELYPGMWTVKFEVDLKSKDASMLPENVHLENEFSIEVLPAKTKSLTFNVVFDTEVNEPKLVVVFPQIELPFVDPVTNLSGEINELEGNLSMNWDYSDPNAEFYVYKELEEQGEYLYEFVGKTREKSYTIENFTKQEYDKFSGIAINVYANGKESGLVVLKKENIKLIDLESVDGISATYNVDTNKLKLDWNYANSNVTFEVLKKSINSNEYEIISQLTQNSFSTEFTGRQFWDLEKIAIRVVANGFESKINEISKDDITITSLNLPLTSSTMYTLFIRSYFDTDGDGVGDFSGVAEKVDYLKSLGVDTVWFLPFNKSKSYHGYDVEDYYDVEPDYGTLQDLDNMIKVLNENGIKVIMDLVVNHTSNTHPWFKDAIENTTNSPYWNYYIMSLDEPQNKDHWHYEINSSGQKVWYFGLFDSSMPDLNYDNPEVMDEVKKIIDFWVDMGVDGFRLDAAKHYYGFDWNDGVEQSASVAKEIENYIKDKLGENAIVVSEVYDGDSNVLLKFAPMPVFNFSFMYNLRGNFEGRDNLISDSISWIDSSLYNLNVFHFPFIDSHDLDRFISELVDSKYQGDVISATKQYLLVNALLLSLTGMPTIYYGDEIGLRGWKWHSEPWDIPVREPMQWYKDQKGNGQTYWTKEFYEGITEGSANEDGAIYDDPDDGVSVEEQENGYSILNFFKEFINLRKEYPALAFGNTTIERDWKNLYVLKKSNNFQDVLVLINLDPTYSNTYEIPEGYKWVWYAFFDGENYEFGEKDEMILQNTGWTINPRQIYIFVK